MSPSGIPEVTSAPSMQIFSFTTVLDGPLNTVKEVGGQNEITHNMAQ